MMFTIKRIYGLLAIAVVLLVAACHKDDNETLDFNSNKTRLQQVVDSLITVYNNAAEGSKPGQYIIGARGVLDSVLTLAHTVLTGQYTQEQVNNAVNSLLAAGVTFSGKLLQEVSVENLMGYWKFNGNANDSSGHGHNGTLATGYVGATAAAVTDGGVLPQLVADRFGRSSMAYDFKSGATIRVPYSAELNPQNITISLWVKRHVSSPSNYMVSLNRWNGYKFQIQGNNFPFFTYMDAGGSAHDVDANPGTVPQDVWTHVAVSYTNGTMKFYINGAVVKTVAASGALATLSTPVDLCLGNELPKSNYNLTNDSNPNYYWGESFLNGSLDDIRIYNTVLTDAEVLSVYTQEKTL